MSVLIATDLDRTLIYSAAAAALGPPGGATLCVEHHLGEPASFMTAAAAAGLQRLANGANGANGSTVVPVTTRTDEQYRRVCLPIAPPRFAVHSNGGVLLIDGTPDPGWSAVVQRELRGCRPLAEVAHYIEMVCDPAFTERIRTATDLFVYAIVRPDDLPAGFVADVSGWAAEQGWTISFQGRKLYWVPAMLTKSAAVAEVVRRTESALLLAAGDSLLDLDLLLAAHHAIHPRHGELYEQGWSAPGVVCTAAAGITAAEEITDWFAGHLA